MIEEENELMLKACFQPKVLPISSAVFNAIASYSGVASELVGGMAFHFKGLNKDYLIKNAKRFRNIELIRYEPDIDMYAEKLKKLYNPKENKNGK